MVSKTEILSLLSVVGLNIVNNNNNKTLHVYSFTDFNLFLYFFIFYPMMTS